MAVPPEVSELAIRIVRHEAGGSEDPASLVAAAEKVCRSLTGNLTDVLGARGVSALLGRALSLAKRDHPLLAGVSLDLEAPACFAGLARSASAASAEEAGAAVSAVIAQLIALLVALLGEDMAMQPVHKLWPHMAFSGGETDE